jgi:hypothetical protein
VLGWVERSSFLVDAHAEQVTDTAWRCGGITVGVGAGAEQTVAASAVRDVQGTQCGDWRTRKKLRGEHYWW